jgi:hypothetical protein
MLKNFKGTDHRDFNSVFLTYIDRLRPEYDKATSKFKFFRKPHDFVTNTAFFVGYKRNSWKKKIVGKFFLIAEIYLGILFLHNKFILGPISLLYKGDLTTKN